MICSFEWFGQISFVIYADKEKKLSKIKRYTVPDDDLGQGLDYTFIEDNHVFKTEGATLR